MSVHPGIMETALTPVRAWLYTCALMSSTQQFTGSVQLKTVAQYCVMETKLPPVACRMPPSCSPHMKMKICPLSLRAPSPPPTPVNVQLVLLHL